MTESDRSPSASDSPGVQPRTWTRRLTRGVLLYALIPYVAVVTIFTLAQRRLIYQPARASSLQAVDFGLSPAQARDVALTTDDGLTLHGWLLAAESYADTNGEADSALEETTDSDRLLIYFSGNAGHRGYRRNDLLEFTRCGFDVLVFDYRGYGDNPGRPSQPAMQADARSVWEYAVDELGADPGRIVLFGESMGGAVATHLAAEVCEQSTPPAALVTNAAFASLTGTVKWHLPLFPFQYLLWDRWPSVERIPQVTCPILMFHGTQDDVVPLSQGRKLFAAAPQQSAGGLPKQFVELPTNGHNDIPMARLKNEVETLALTIFDERTVAD